MSFSVTFAVEVESVLLSTNFAIALSTDFEELSLPLGEIVDVERAEATFPELTIFSNFFSVLVPSVALVICLIALLVSFS